MRSIENYREQSASSFSALARNSRSNIEKIAK